MTLFDVLALVCGLVMLLKMPKRVYKGLGLSLVVCVLWQSVLTPTFKSLRSNAKALVSPTAMEWTQNDLQMLIVTEASAIGLDPAIALAFSEMESGHRNVIGDNGKSFGPMQVQAQFHIPEGDPTDPRVSVRAGVRVLSERLTRYNGDIVKARLAYVCGTPDGCSHGKARRIKLKLASVASGYGLSL